MEIPGFTNFSIRKNIPATKLNNEIVTPLIRANLNGLIEKFTNIFSHKEIKLPRV